MKPLLTALALLILVTVPAKAETFPLIGKALVCVDEHENPEESPLADENGIFYGWFIKFFKDKIEMSHPFLSPGNGTVWETIPSHPPDPPGGPRRPITIGEEYFTPPVYIEEPANLEWSYSRSTQGSTYRRNFHFSLTRITLSLTVNVEKIIQGQEPSYASQSKLCRVTTHKSLNHDLEKAYEDFVKRRKI